MSSLYTPTSVDKMNGIGMPILFIFFVSVAGLVTHQLLVKAVKASFGDPIFRVCFIASIVNVLISVLLYFSTAYNYALFTTVLAYGLICIGSQEDFRSKTSYFLLGYALWFLVVAGIPSQLNMGIIEAVSKPRCLLFYNTFAETMCVGSWLTVVKLLASVVVGLNLLLVLILAGDVLGSASDTSTSAKQGRPTTATQGRPTTDTTRA